MSVLIHDIDINQGATFQREFTATHPDTGLPFDMTGGTALAQLWDEATGTLAATFGSLITTNKLLIELTATVTNALPPGTTFTHHYRAQVTMGAVVYIIAKGRAAIFAP
jgi:hypothetical protein